MGFVCPGPSCDHKRLTEKRRTDKREGEVGVRGRRDTFRHPPSADTGLGRTEVGVGLLSVLDVTPGGEERPGTLPRRLRPLVTTSSSTGTAASPDLPPTAPVGVPESALTSPFCGLSLDRAHSRISRPHPEDGSSSQFFLSSPPGGSPPTPVTPIPLPSPPTPCGTLHRLHRLFTHTRTLSPESSLGSRTRHIDTIQGMKGIGVKGVCPY